jgi:NADPH:quinone reductase-like Zn-dependent oxidoreductase
MKAIVQDGYGSPDVLRLEDVETPVATDDQVLVRVQAAAVNIGDWHLLRGQPYIMRIATGPFKPRHDVPGLDLAGQVESVGKAVTQLRPGDEIFGWPRGCACSSIAPVIDRRY